MEGLQIEIKDQRNLQPLRTVPGSNVGSGGVFGLTGGASQPPLPPDFFSRREYGHSNRGAIDIIRRSSMPVAGNIQEPLLVERVPSRTVSFRERELHWRNAHPEFLTRYQNEWVVLECETIIAHGSSVAQVIREAKSQGIRTPYIFFVEPKSENLVRIGL